MEEQLFLQREAPDGGLFQSENWARLQEMSGHESVTFESEGFQGFAFCHKLPFLGNYLSIPRGPVMSKVEGNSEALQKTFEKLREKEKIAWIRVEPQTENVLHTLEKFFGENIVPAPRDIQPREILVLSLEGTEEEWLARMKSKTRYNVGLAQRHGLTVRFSREEKDLESFLLLIQSTAERKAIRPHPKEYYRNFFRVFSSEECKLALVEKEGEVLAASLLVFYAKYAYYLHGGSKSEKRDLMAPFLLHFASMKEAKRRECLFYDLGGVRLRSKKNETDTGWDGITRFKLGFAPHQETLLFPGTFDIILNTKKYFLYRKLQELRNFFRK